MDDQIFTYVFCKFLSSFDIPGRIIMFVCTCLHTHTQKHTHFCKHNHNSGVVGFKDRYKHSKIRYFEIRYKKGNFR